MVFSDTKSMTGATKIESIFLSAYIIMIGDCFYFAFSDISSVDTVEKAGNSDIYRAIWLCLYCGLLILSLKNVSTFVARYKIPALLFLTSLVAYLFNGFQSENMMKLTLYIMTLHFGLWLATRFTFEQFFHIYYRVASFIVIVHLCLFPVVSHISQKFEPLARHNVFGTSIYSGLFAHKNEAGLFFGIALVIGFCKIAFSNRSVKISDLLSLCLIFFSLGMAGAASPLISAIFACAAITSLYVAQKNGKVGLAAVLFLLPFPVMLLVNAEWFLGLFGRDLSLTGRNYAYESWFSFFREHFLFGYGYGEFFRSTPDAPGVRLNAGRAYAHFINFESGILQTGIDFGVVGLAAISFLFLYAGYRAIGYSRSEGKQRYTPIGIVIFLFISTLNEVYIVAFNTLTPALLFYIYTRFRMYRGNKEFLNRPQTSLNNQSSQRYEIP